MSETNPETGIAYLAAGSDDGDYGPITASAVKAWQKNNNLEDDGKFGRQSLAVAQTAVEGVDDVVITPIASKAIVSTDGGALHIDVSSSSLQIGDTTFTGDGAKLLARRTADLEGSLEHPVDIRLRNEEGNVAGTFDLSKQGTASIIATPVGEYVADRIVGEGKELAVTTLDSALVAVGFKPYGAEMRTTIQHYVEGTGEPLDIGEIPQEFVDVIMEQTGGNPGTYEINPYTTRDYAVTHAFGHFYVSIPEEGSTGYMTDYYDFSMGSHSVAQGGAHGFQVASMPDEAVYVANNHVLPSTEFKSTGGKEIERVELTNVQVGDEQRTILFIPSEVLDKAGKPYQIRGTFQIPTRETSG